MNFLMKESSPWRNKWMSEIEEIAFAEWNGGLSLEEWKDGFNVLKQPGTYEFTLGDLVPPGIAHCTRKNLLIFNTSPQAHSPVYVISAATFGGSANTDIPICLAYDQAHYESLVPSSQSDIEKTIILSKQVLSGEYSLKMGNISIFECQLKKAEFTSAHYDNEFPPLASKQKEVNKKRKGQEYSSNINEDCMLTLEELKKIPIKKRNKGETKRYNNLMYQRRKVKIAEEQNDLIRTEKG
jgi:hypothetical protein